MLNFTGDTLVLMLDLMSNQILTTEVRISSLVSWSLVLIPYSCYYYVQRTSTLMISGRTYRPNTHRTTTYVGMFRTYLSQALDIGWTIGPV